MSKRTPKKCADKRVYILKHPHMKYNTFAVLRDMIERAKEKAHQEYVIAADFTYGHEYDGLSQPQFRRGCKVLPNSVREFMWENYRQLMAYYEDMLKQLHYAAIESNRTHPNPKMREFWGIKES